MAGALQGVRVVDFGQWIAGPLAAMLLSDQGAEVIHIDPPEGPRWEHVTNATINRGKQSIRLDLKSPSDSALARELVDSADVVIENFRPGVMRQLGLAWEDVRHGHERLIYCSIPGFAADDPRAGMPGWEGVVAAATASYPAGPGRRRPVGADAPRPSDQPRFTALSLASEYGALAAAIGIVMALVARERDDLGQRIEIPLFDAMFLAVGSSGLLVNGGPSGGRPADPWGGIYTTGGASQILLSLATPRFLRRFLEATGKYNEWEDKGYLNPGVVEDSQTMARLRADMSALFLSRTAEEWDELATEINVPLTKVRTSAEWMAAKHGQESGILVPVDDPEYGSMLQPGPQVRLRGTPSAVQGPRSEMTADGLRALLRVERPRSSSGVEAPIKAPLEGYRVIDTTSVLAGPTAGRTLAEFGAEVVKINNPYEEGSGYRWQVHRYHTDVNRGKKSILIDLKTTDGLGLLWRLVDKADVFLQNMRLGVTERLGIGYEQVRDRKPGIVYVSISAFGYGGEWSYRPGYEPVAQSFSGMQARSPQPYAVNDYCTGLLGAFGAGLALYHRLRTGEGQSADTSLAQAATYLQLPYLQLYEGKAWDEPKGPDAKGWSPLQRLYCASDGWFFLGAAKSQATVLSTIDGLAATAGLDSDELEAKLDECFAAKPVDEWLRLLTAAEIGAYAVRTTVKDLMTDPWVVAHGLSVTQTYKDGSAITTIGPPWRMSRTPVSPRHLVSPPGGDAAEVLASVGLADRLHDLVEKRAVVPE